MKIQKTLWVPICTGTIVFLCICGSIKICWKNIEDGAHVAPNYPQENIEAVLSKEMLDEQDYVLLFNQTGLSPAAVDFLFAKNRQQELLEIQELLFADVEIKCKANSILTREERLKKRRVLIPYVENGDILISLNSHALGWRNGHAAMVVDAEKRLVLEAQVLGTNSTVMSMSHWETYPSFVILRLKDVAKEQRAEIAANAVETLNDIPYRLEAGVIEKLKNRIWVNANESVSLSGTHCAHLVWYAYQEFGYDLDSDGGIIVTPHDLLESPYLEVIQIYGSLRNS